MERQQLQHVVAMALPAQGHLTSLMRFCKLLAHRQQQGLVIVTFVDIDIIHDRVEGLQNAADQGHPAAGAGKIFNDDDGDADEARPALPLIRRAHISIPGVDLSKDFNFSFRSLFQALRPSIGPALLHLIPSLHPPVTCLLSDFPIALPIQDIAHQLAIPNIVLFPSSASRLLLFDYVAQGELVSMDGVSKALATTSTRKEVFCKGLLGLPTLFNIDIPHSKHVQDDNIYLWNFGVQSWKILKTQAHSIVINSFDKLEASTFMALSKCSKVPIYGIGPWIETLHEECATNLWKEDEACLTWLEQQPTSSVLYISFGSITILSQGQFEEILNGLRSSKQRFLWAFRHGLVDDAPSSSMPTYVMEKCDGRGFVVDWAPQLKVLAHPSVGGFLTHCGWNSVIESIAHGVPMLCWPYFADQLLNARCIVDEWKVGLQFEAREESPSFYKRDEIERVILSLMEDVEGGVVRKNVAILQEASRDCLLHNGSSYKNLKSLMTSLT